MKVTSIDLYNWTALLEILPHWELVKLKLLDFSDDRDTVIAFLCKHKPSFAFRLLVAYIEKSIVTRLL